MKKEFRTAAILAGGKSSRFGTNKALAPWKNGTLVIEAVISSVKIVSDKTFIVSNHPKPYLNMGLEIIPDEFPGKGPLAGIHAALKHAKGSRVFIIACDMPLTRPEIIDWMWNIKTSAPAIVPVNGKSFEPLHAIYHKSLIPVLENHLIRGALSLKMLLKEIPCHIIEKKEWLANTNGLIHFTNINTQDELKKLIKGSNT
jgi:molybdopterin-guanine dinucleotide biosynthesis protein A